MSTRQKLLRITKYALGAGVAGVGGTLGGIRLWTRKTYFEEFTPDTDPLYHLPLLKKINPHNNPTLNDCCVRKIPYGQLKTDLLEDQKRGGEKLVNAFSQGMWGGYGFAIQRRLNDMLRARTKENEGDLWSKEQILNSDFAIGETITDELRIISRTPTSITMRGPSPRPQDPEELLDMDNIGEVTVALNEKEQVVEFRFKNIFFAGKGKQDHPPFPEFVAQLHYLYVRLLTESGVARCLK